MDNFLIQYPSYIPNPTVKGYYPKVKPARANEIYDEFIDKGLDLIPKIRRDKIPLAKYWRKDKSIGNLDACTAKAEQSHVDVSGWCCRTGDIVVLDLDNSTLVNNGYDFIAVYYFLMGLSESGFVFSTPTGGLHIYYRLPKNVDKEIRNVELLDGLDVRGAGGQVVFYGAYNRYDDSDAKKKGVISGHLGSYNKIQGADYSEVPYMSMELYDFIINSKHFKVITAGEVYGLSNEGKDRIETFDTFEATEKLDVVIELCNVILNNWDSNKTYSEWCQFWMSAHNASSGSRIVRELIVKHGKIDWSDGDEGKQSFVSAWDTFRSVGKYGYTISSLFYLARNEGWLTQTGYEIDSEIVEIINTGKGFIGDWFDKLDKVPNRVLLESQTGSGKTYMFTKLWKRLKRPKTVIFCPSVKLATEMANTLSNEHRLPVVLYKDTESGDTVSISSMLDAKILVVTLQTFAIHLYSRGVDLTEYGLFYFEESDQLLSQFSRGGGGQYSSHVREIEAQLGFKLLKDCLTKVSNVWFVDATMTQVTYSAVNNITDDFKIFRNMAVKRKVDVEFVENKEQAYKLIIEGIYTNKKVVVACDTKTEVFFVREMLEFLKVLDTIKAVFITKDTSTDSEVIEFMADVNKGALAYDLVVYNSAMGSGVSITSVQPDIIVQLGTFLSPRVNLQILNRYRKQLRVVCYYYNFENINGLRDEEIIKIANTKLINELTLIDLPKIERTELAVLRANVAAIAVADENAQKRNPKLFYQSLLLRDGRDIVDYSDKVFKVDVKSVVEATKDLREIDKVKVRNNWRSIPPIDDSRPAKIDYSYMDVALGLAHALVEKVFLGKIPDNSLVEDGEIYRLASMFYRHHYVITKLLDGGGGIGYYEKYLNNKDKAITAYWNDLSTMNLFMIVQNYFWRDISDNLNMDIVKDNAEVFVKEIAKVKHIYNNLHRRRIHYEKIMQKSDTIENKAITFSKNILSLVGLKQRLIDKNRRLYGIVNYSDLELFMKLKGRDKEIKFDIDYINEQVKERKDERNLYDTLSKDIKDEVLELLSKEKGMTFKAAVSTVNRPMEIV